MNIKYNIELDSIIDTKKTEWVRNIKDVTPLLRSAPENMTDANALVLSYRAMLLEEVSYFMSLFASHEREMKVLKRDKFIYYSTGMLPDGNKAQNQSHPLLGRKLSKTEYDIVISGDLTECEYTMQVINDMVEFLKEIIKTIDQILYSIKNRLDLFNYLK